MNRESRKLNIMFLNPLLLSHLNVLATNDTKFVTNIANEIEAGPVEIINITQLGRNLTINLYNLGS